MTSNARDRTAPHLTPSVGEAEPYLLRLLAPVDAEAIAAAIATEPDVRGLLDAVGIALYTTDVDGHITYFNDAAAELWGRRPEMGEEWCGSFRLYWPDGRPMRHDECPMARTLLEGRAVRGGTAFAERPDGSRVAFEAYPSPLRAESGELLGAINLLVDITDRLAVELAMRDTTAELRRSNAVKDEFLGLVSHELRTPVTTIYGNAELLLQRSGALSEEVRGMLADVAADSEHLLGIIENLLLLTRSEAGAVPEFEPQLLGHVIRRASAAFATRRGRIVNVQASVRDHLVVEADRTYLELLFGNLLSNADKYSPAEQPIDVILDAVDGEVLVSVLDRGIGLGEDDESRIFTAFYRSPTAKRRASGMGIGLAVCKRIIEAQGGRMWARNRSGGGADIGFAMALMRDPGD